MENNIRISNEFSIITDDNLNFMEITSLIKFISEYIDYLQFEMEYNHFHGTMSDEVSNRINRKLKEANNIKNKLDHIWEASARKC